MPERVQCPSCGGVLTAPARLAGHTARCPRCSKLMRLPGQHEVEAPAAPPITHAPGQPGLAADESGSPQSRALPSLERKGGDRRPGLTCPKCGSEATLCRRELVGLWAGIVSIVAFIVYLLEYAGVLEGPMTGGAPIRQVGALLTLFSGSLFFLGVAAARWKKVLRCTRCRYIFVRRVIGATVHPQRRTSGRRSHGGRTKNRE
jgi:hypothetical protein